MRRSATKHWVSSKTPLYRRAEDFYRFKWRWRTWSEWDARRLDENVTAVQERMAMARHRECAKTLLTVGGRPIFGAFGLIKDVKQ